MRQGLIQTISLIKADFKARCDYEGKRLTFLRVIRFLFHFAIQPTIVYRWQVFFHTHHLGFVAGLLKYLSSLAYTVSIESDTEIGAGLMLLHANCIYIGSGVKIGERCILIHQNSIMASPFAIDAEGQGKDGAPVIGDDFLLGGGASVVGNVTIGNDVKVSMNTTVNQDFPDHAVLLGVPARNIVQKKNDEAEGE